jgi:hypothetical protein
MDIHQIYLRDSEAAFENAIKKGHAHVCDTATMYMYTKYGDGKPYDVFKHKITRKHETVDVEEIRCVNLDPRTTASGARPTATGSSAAKPGSSGKLQAASNKPQARKNLTSQLIYGIK